jgi:hypothetical protein
MFLQWGSAWQAPRSVSPSWYCTFPLPLLVSFPCSFLAISACVSLFLPLALHRCVCFLCVGCLRRGSIDGYAPSYSFPAVHHPTSYTTQQIPNTLERRPSPPLCASVPPLSLPPQNPACKLHCLSPSREPPKFSCPCHGVAPWPAAVSVSSCVFA